MNLFTVDELTALTTASNSTCISIYAPMERLGIETQQNPIRLKNLVRQAVEKLLAMGLPEQDAKELLQPIHELDTYDFWQHQSDGLAIFLSPNQFRYYCLPIAFPELTVVGDRFHIKPLLQLISGDGTFSVLALSQNQVRLFQGTRYHLKEVELTDVPTNIAAALQYDDPQKSLQAHTGSSKGNSAIFHGQGAGNEDQKNDLLRYFRQVNNGLESFFKNQQAPLILAGVDYLFPIYHEANTYANLLPDGIPGNPETLTLDELHTQAWQIAQPYFDLAKVSKFSHYEELQGSEQTANTIEKVVTAAYFQRVETLFVPINKNVWGVFNPEANSIQIHDRQETGDEDLLDLAALHTLTNGGTVYAVEQEDVPEHKAIAAILRY
ncbi:baeRF7 domain-containing protein [Microcoleus sp. B4-D4]|uniref:baeRF7 domain-containing protein n=1 Tax=Microcoleus sp. B4-D4 TaxID=2818667 RepID=UPI002FD52621